MAQQALSHIRVLDPTHYIVGLYCTSNRKGITINIKIQTGRRIFQELVREADVAVENFRPGVMVRLGLD